MKKMFFFIILLILSSFLFSNDLVTVLYIVDGDTIEVLFKDGKTERIRMIGIDCPESLKKNNPDEYEGISDIEYLHNWAVQIKKYTENKLINKKVELQYDSISDKRGYFGRLLAYIIIDEVNLNIDLVRKGYAKVYTEAPCDLMNELLSAQKEAMVKRLGIWSGAVTKIETIRNNFIIATDVHYDAEGNDNHNLNDEYFALKNISDNPLNLSSWIISDAKGKNKFTIPDGFILGPGMLVYILHRAPGQNTKNKLYWGSKGTAIWNNSGDKIYIQNPQGEIYELYSWK